MAKLTASSMAMLAMERTTLDWVSRKCKEAMMRRLTVSFDYQVFSRNGKATVESVSSVTLWVATRRFFAQMDIKVD